MKEHRQCTSCGRDVERSPRHPDPDTVRTLLCTSCFGASSWAWFMWKGPQPGGGSVIPVVNAQTAARPRAIAAVVLASMLRRRWSLLQCLHRKDGLRCSGRVETFTAPSGRTMRYGYCPSCRAQIGYCGGNALPRIDPDATFVRIHTWTDGPGEGK